MSDVPRVNVTQIPVSPLHEKRCKNLTVLDNTILDQSQRINFIIKNRKHSIKNQNSDEFSKNSSKLTTSTPNSSDIIEPIHELNKTFTRHLELKHPEENRVKVFLAYPRKSAIRLELIAKIRNDGDYKYNKSLTGILLKNRIVIRQPNASKPKEPTEFSYCPSCHASVSQKTLSAHFKHCTGRDGKKHRVIKKLSKIYDEDYHPEACIKLRNLIVCMHVDDVSNALKYDTLLIHFGNTLCDKLKLDQHKEMIRNRLRLLAKLLITTQKIEKRIFEINNLKKSLTFVPKIKNMTCLFHPQHINICIRAVNIIAGGNDKNYDMESPSVASLIGTLLKQLGEFLRVENVMSGLKHNNEVVVDFLLVVNRKWADVINKNVQEAQLKKKRQKKISLPTTEDINKLMDSLIKQQALAYNSLEKKFSSESYSNLAESTLIIIQMFNRRRAGEMERVLWEDFKLYTSLKQDNFKDIMKNMSDEARKFCDKYVRFSIRGKLGRGVAVLLDETMFNAIIMLEKNRLQNGIRPNNPYIFGLPGYSDDQYSYLRACKLMRQYSRQCGAKSPELLRGTILRKHIATYLVNHNVANIDRTKLASHLGHNMGVHENYYHLHNLAEEISQLPRVLESACGAKHGSQENNDDSSNDSDFNSEYEQSDSESEALSQENYQAQNSSINKFELSHLSTSKSPSECSLDEDLNASLKASCRRQKWEKRHIDAMHRHFSDEIKSGRYPNSKKMKQVCSIEPLLANRAIPAMRTWFSNHFKKTKPGKKQ